MCRSQNPNQRGSGKGVDSDGVTTADRVRVRPT
jgi:hypothetical protein